MAHKQEDLYTTIHRLSQCEGRFHVPGHKGNPAAIPQFGAVLRHDLTEVEGADDLQHPTGPIAASEARMAALYASGATLYSASGSTSCIEAMLTLFLQPGQGVVMARNCHLSAVRALGFLDATPHWVLPKNGRPQPADIDTALRDSGAKVAYITSPDYYGHIADIPTIAEVCRRHGARLLVDNAHGAHLHFLPGVVHPIHAGADACCDSAHKTLPCLTPAALLHLEDATLAANARRALNLYSSTSPSYLVLQSLDLAALQLAETPPDFAAAAARLAKAAATCPAMVQPGDDPLKLCLHPARAGLAYGTVLDALAREGVTPELADGTHIVLMASPWNTPAAFTALEKSLSAFAGAKPHPVEENTTFTLPKPLCSVRKALFSQSENLPVNDTVGRVAAEVCAPCPPGIPVVIPGERVSAENARLLHRGGISRLCVVK